VRSYWGSVVTSLVALFLFTSLTACSKHNEDALVVYCAHDAIFSESILRKFEEETGIPVHIRFDTEATKSLGLVELLIREKQNPRCDVFWNNELLGTLDLMDHDLLEPYKGAGWNRISEPHKDPDGRWVGFAARMRVWIVNKDQHEVTPAAVEKTSANPDLADVTIAKALYGTTRTHYTVLWHCWGRDELINWHRDWRKRNLSEAQSNGQTRNLVAQGVCKIGWTDTDDYFGAVDQNKPVAMLPYRLPNTQQVICIPNTVGIIKGTKRLEKAQKLVDYLTSAKTEIALANSESRQIPLGPVDESKLSKEVRALVPLTIDAYPLTTLGDARSDCLDWLKQEYLQ